MTGQLTVAEHGTTMFAGGHPSRKMLEPMPNVTISIVFTLGADMVLHFNDHPTHPSRRPRDEYLSALSAIGKPVRCEP